MRSSTIKISLITLIATFVSSTFAFDTSVEEKTCSEIGFKRKTEPFANCVLELVQRKGGVRNTVQSAPTQSVGNNPDDLTCNNYGFKTGTNDFAQCKLQINNARQQAQIQQRQYDEQKRQYDEQQAQIKKQRDREQSQRQFDMFQRLAQGESITNVGRAGMGLPPLQAPTPPSNQTFVMPNGRVMNCNTTGTITNCF